MSYAVVFRNLTGSTKGVLTWGSYDNREAFTESNDDEMKARYEVVEEGITEERAIQLCSPPEAPEVAIGAMLHQAADILAETNKIADGIIAKHPQYFKRQP